MILYKSALTDRIFENLSEQEGDIITTITGKSISRTEFTQDIYTQAKALKNIGVQYGDRVAFLHRDSIFFAKSIIASFLCGATVVLLDPEMGQEMLREKIRSTGISHIFIEGRVYDFFHISGFDFASYGAEWVIVGWSLFGSKLKKFQSMEKDIISNNLEYKVLDGTHECMIVFTGGTTGNPKGVVHAVSSLMASTEKITGLLHNPSIFYADMPHFLLLGLLIGVKVIAGKPNISPKKFLKVLSKYQVDTYFSPPYKYNYAIQYHIELPDTLQNIILGSAPIHVGFLKNLLRVAQHVPYVICTYGMTEVLPIASIDAREKVLQNISGDILGYILYPVQYSIVNGELHIEKDSSTGYYLDESNEHDIATGDMVSVDGKMLIMQGRKKDMIIRRDYNIYPSLYESIISRIPGVIEVALVGIYDECDSDERVILFLEMMKDGSTKKQILGFLRSGKYSIDSFALPDEVIFMKLPRVGRQQKVDKGALRNMYLQIHSK